MVDPLIVRALIEALGIGFLIGIEREKDKGPGSLGGLRSFVLCSLAGALAALSGSIALATMSLGAVAGLVVAGRLRSSQSNMASDVGAIVTFWLGYLTREHEMVSLMLAIVTASALAAKQPLHDFATKQLSEIEFYDTLKFLAIVFIIYPILPDRGYGPYAFLNPHSLWLFVILVSSISYIGYFLTKFLGTERGELITAIVGGLASTTAATIAFAHRARENPDQSRMHAVAAIAANSVQFPRLWAILYAVSPPLAKAAVIPLGVALATGAAMTLLLYQFRGARLSVPTRRLHVENPFSIRPALGFGFYYALILLLTRAASGRYGAGGLYATSFLGGSFDVDAIAVTVAGMVNRTSAVVPAAIEAVLLAATANAVVKVALATWRGTRVYGAWLSLGAAVVFAATWGAYVLFIP